MSITVNEIASLIAAEEGRRSQAKIGDIREILSILSDYIYADEEIVETLRNNGQRRSWRRVKVAEKAAKK